MYDNNFNGENENSENNNSEKQTYSDIRYTYNPNADFSQQGNPYNTNMGDGTKKKKKSSNGIFIAIISVLLCVTAAAAGISGWTLIKNKSNLFSGNNNKESKTEQQTENAPVTNENSSAFDSVVKVNPTPTPTVVEGQILTEQQVAEKVTPCVVCIQCYATTTDFFGSTNTSALYSEGSGIISRTDGYIITNAHVISEASSVQVILNNGTICDATIIGKDTVTDLALLKIDPTGLNLTAAEFSTATSARVADTVLAIGNPGGLDFFSSVTRGIISALNRSIQDDDTGYVMHCIQTDTAINPGNSGGPLVDMYGHVIGITSSKIVAQGYESMGFAITYDEAAPILNDLMQYGHVKNRATINISLTLSSSVFRNASRNSIPTGLCVISVTGEDEANAGLKAYDIITAIDDTKITSMADYSSYILSKKPGDKVTLYVYRATISGWSVQYSSTPIEIQLTLSEAN